MEPSTQTPTDTPQDTAVQNDTPLTNEPTTVPEDTQVVAQDGQQEVTDNQQANAADNSASPATVVTTDEEEEVPQYQTVPPVPPIDFSQLPVDENNLIDPNALAGVINQRIAMAEQNAAAQAQRIYAEQDAEKRLWERAFEKYPDLKTNKELQGLVHQARLGEATDLLSRSADPNSVKLPTPGQVADKLFKQIGSAKTEGMQQATTNTVVQKSAQLETAARKSDTEVEGEQQARANLNNPNKQIADKARSELLKKYLGWK